MSSSRYKSKAHQRDSRTQLFQNAGSYSSAEVIDGSSRLSSSARNNVHDQTGTKNHYSDAVLSQLESQNDEQIEGLTAKVRLLKDVASKIGDEVRDSNKLIQTMEEGFESAKTRLKGTMFRMMRMAERSGVGWRAWLMLFAFVGFCFWIVRWR